MATTTISIDVDVDDVIDAMPDWHKEDLCQYLITMGFGPHGSLPTAGYHPDEEMYREAVVTLLGMYSQLDPADVARIRQLAGK
jgi:hypothetical protein